MGGAAHCRDQHARHRSRPKKRLTALHLALEGEGPAPEEWLISQICEEFGCTPLEALRQPIELTERIMEMRTYATVKRMIAEAKTEADVPDHPMVDMVMSVEADRLRQRQAATRPDKPPKPPKPPKQKAQV